MTKAYRYALPQGHYTGDVDGYGFRVANSRPEKPEIIPGFWPRWPVENPDAQAWEQVEDHRERKPPYYPEEYAQDATEFWLPGDAWNSPARRMIEIGSLPEGALLHRPEKPLEMAKEEKRREITAAHSTVLEYLLAESPSPTPIEAALAVEDMREFDPEGLQDVRARMDARRDELLGMVNRALTLAEVQAVSVSYPV